MPNTNQPDASRRLLTPTDADRYDIACIQQQNPELTFETARLLNEYRCRGSRNLEESEVRFCKALERQIAKRNAAAAIPIRTNDNGPPQASSARTTPPKLIEAHDWQDVPVPQRQWAVQGRVPHRNVTLVSGAGGVGKSTLLLQLSCAHVTDRDWFGTMPVHGDVLFLSAEDDADELHFRTASIAAHLGVSMSDLAGLHFIALAGEDALLGVPDRSGVMRATPLLNTLREAALDLKLANIVIDTAADTFGGRENDRAQVRQFITLLRGVAIAADAALMLSSHPSLTGLSSGSGLSGSTAWDASVRARMYLTPMEGDDGTPVSDTDLRELIIKKSNYGPTGERVRMRWQNGLFVPVGTPSNIDQRVAEAKAESAFLDLLDLFIEQNQRVGPYKGPNYAPAKFADHPTGSPFGSRKLAAAMQRLLDAKRIRIKEEGPTSRRVTFLVRT